MRDLAILADPRHIRADLRAIRGAIRSGWEIDPDTKAEIVRRVVAIVDDPQTDRMTIKACLTLVRMTEDNHRRIRAALRVTAPDAAGIVQ
jgi:hypothetical protein